MVLSLRNTIHSSNEDILKNELFRDKRDSRNKYNLDSITQDFGDGRATPRVSWWMWTSYR